MREDFLHFIWKYKKFSTQNLKTSSNKEIRIIRLGEHNHLAGPDFFNSQLIIDNQEWVGNVEIHINSSDWFIHGHEKDANYDNVILHVVWQDDVNVSRKDGSKIPCLVLKDYVIKDVLSDYKTLMIKKKFINCEADFSSIDEIYKFSWLERMFVERLQQKSELIFKLLQEFKNDWEKVLFCLLMKNFGLNKNGQVFLEIAKIIDFARVRKVFDNVTTTESLLFGVANLLEEDFSDDYFLQLKSEFTFLKKKFGLRNELLPNLNFYGLRPHNFPTIRLSQLANLYVQHQSIFQQIIAADSVVDLKNLFQIKASEYWTTHYVFDKEGGKRVKSLSKDFIELLVINTVLPLKFAYQKSIGKDVAEQLFELASSLKAEKNSTIEKFGKIGETTKNAFESQAKLQLYNQYCTKNRCLKCSIGNKLLLRNS